MSVKMSKKNIVKISLAALSVFIMFSIALTAWALTKGEADTSITATAAETNSYELLTAPKFGTNNIENAGTYAIPTTTTDNIADHIAFTIDFPVNDDYDETDVNGYYTNLNPDYAVAYALIDENVDVTIRLTFETDGIVGIRAKWGSEPAGELQRISGSSTVTTTHSGGSNPGTLSFEVLAPRSEGYTATGIKPKSIFVIAETDTNAVNVYDGTWQVTVSGNDRATESYDAGTPDADIPYIKIGDKVNIKYVFTANKPEFSQLFTTIFRPDGTPGSCIDWTENSGRSALVRSDIVDNSYVYYKYGGTQSTSNDIYYGIETTFIAQAQLTSLTGDSVEIQARIPSSRDNNVYYLNQGSAITVKVDCTPPSIPRLTTSPEAGYVLGNSIREGLWYTSRLAQPQYESVTASASVGAAERVYAFVVNAGLGITTVEGIIAQLNLRSDVPPNETGFTYTVGSEYTATRQDLGEFSNAPNADKEEIDFGAETGKLNPVNPGELGLLLVAVDGAGNYSYWLYSASGSSGDGVQSASLRVDWTERTIVPSFTVPGSEDPVQGTEAGTYASVYVLAGDSYHDENGNFTGGVFLPGGNLNAAAITYSVKRVRYITLRVVMSPAQYNAFTIVSYNAESTGRGGEPVFSEMEANGVVYRYFDITFPTDSGEANSWWGSYAGEGEDSYYAYNRFLSARVNARVIPTLAEGADELEFYNGIPREISTGGVTMTMYDGSELGGIQPEVAIEYFKRLTMVFYSNVNANGTNISPGGSIEVDGVEIFSDSARDMNTFMRPGMRFDFEVSDGKGGTITRTFYIFSLIESNWEWEIDDSGQPLTRATRTAYVVELTAPNATGGFIDAGTYYYRLFVNDDADSNFYYGETIAEFTISPATANPNNAAAYNRLTYGQSLDELKFSTVLSDNVTVIYPEIPSGYGDDDNLFITGPDKTKYPFVTIGDEPYPMYYSVGGTTYYYTVGGVYGVFNIITPSSGSADYMLPGTLNEIHLVVEFVPMTLSFTPQVIADNYSQFFKFFYDAKTSGGATEYIVKEGAPHAGNYSATRFEVNISIDKREIELSPDDENYLGSAEDGRFEYTYDEMQHIPVFKGEWTSGGEEIVPGEELDLTMKFYLFDDDGDISSEISGFPQYAGSYMVAVSVNSGSCNYVTAGEAFFMLTILKQKVTLTLTTTGSNEDGSGYVGGSGSLTFGGVSGTRYDYSHELRYYYNHLGTPEFKVVNENGFEVGTAFTYQLTRVRYFNETGIEVDLASEEIFDAAGTIYPTGSYPAGVYILTIGVGSENHEVDPENPMVLRYNIVQGNYNNNTEYFNLIEPTIRQTYGDITFGAAHMEFGMSLIDARSALDGGSVYFNTYSITGGIREPVAGLFFFESEEDYQERYPDYTYTYTDKDGEELTVLDVRYNSGGSRYASHFVTMYWMAGVYNDGEFIPDYNFMRVERTVEIIVAKGSVDLSGVKATEIIYGEKLNASRFGGTAVTRSGNRAFEVSENGEASGLGSISFTTPDFIPAGGTYSAVVNFFPDDTARYYSSESGLVSVKVSARETVVTFIPTGNALTPDDLNGEITDTLENALYRIYGSAFTNPLFEMRAEAVDGRLEAAENIPTGTVDRVFTYYIEGSESDHDFEYEGKYYKRVDMPATTDVGRYFVRIELTDENYSGAAFAEFYVIKATLTPQYGYIPNYTVEYSDVINDLRIGGSVESSAGAGGVLTVFEGFFTITGILVRGADGSVTVAELPDNYNALPVNSEALLENVRVEFSPDVNEDVYLKNFRPFESNYTLTVTRKDISENIVIDGLSEGVSEKVFNNDDKFLSLATTAEGTFDADPKGEGVSVSFVYYADGALAVAGVTNAGSYLVTAKVVEEGSDYCGEVSFELIVAPHEVWIANEAVSEGKVLTPYTGTTYAFLPEFEFKEGEEIVGVDPSALPYTVSYLLYNYPNPIPEPYEIGSYRMDIVIGNTNYIARAADGTDTASGVSLGLDIHPCITALGNTEQTYKPEGKPDPVTPIYTAGHPELNYLVSYFDADGNEVSVENAGEYKVVIKYVGVNGLNYEYVGTLTVNPLEVTGFLQETYRHVYDGSAYRIEKQYVLQYSLQTIAEFSYYDEDGNKTENPVNAGVYTVKAVVPEGENFSGSDECLLNISPAALKMTGRLPSITMYYGSDKEIFNGILKEMGGTWSFVNGYNEVIPGAFVIDDESDDTAELLPTFGTGTRRINIVFKPGLYVDSEEGRLYAVNYSEYAQTVSVNILQRDISDAIRIAGEPEYNPERDAYIIESSFTGASQPLSYIVTDGVEDYSVQVTLTYNGSKTAPRAAGEYRVGGYVSDAAYSGEFKGVRHETDEDGNIVYKPLLFIIDSAKPIIDYSGVRVTIDGTQYSRVPLDPDNAGGLLPQEITIDMISGLKAGIPGIDSIEGKWSLVDGKATISKANENYVKVRFAPYDQSSYYTITAEIVIMGDGVDPKITFNTTIDTSFTYGTKLKEILSKYGFSVADDIEGEFTFYSANGAIDGYYIPSTNETLTYTFTPDAEHIEVFNVISGTFKPVGSKKELTVGKDVTLNAFGYFFLHDGNEYAEGDLNFVFGITGTGQDDADMTEGFGYEVINFPAISLENPVAAGGTIQTRIEIKFTHPNYVLVDENDGDYLYVLSSVHVYFEVTDIDYNESKTYDGEAPTEEELEIRAGGTETTVGFVIDEVSRDGKVLEDGLAGIVGAGEYIIKVHIEGSSAEDMLSGNVEQKYYGVFELSYTVEPKDLSDHIVIYGTEKTYGETVRVYGVLNGIEIGEEFGFDIRYYDSQGALLSAVPVDAGNYSVEAAISGNTNYTGSARADYIINQAPATITFTGSGAGGYSFDYDGLSKRATVSVSNNLTESGVAITYYKGTSVVTAPVDPGTYRVVAQITDKNYYGSAETTLTINKAPLQLTTTPEVSVITYGTKVSAAVVSDNFVVHTVGFNSTVDGKFVPVNPDEILPAGTHSVRYIFKPELDFYEELTVTFNVTVEKAVIQITVLNPDENNRLVYDGTPKEPVVISDQGIGYRKEFRNEAGTLLSSAPSEAGNYSVTYTINDPNYTGSNIVEFTVHKAELSVEASVLPESVQVRYGAKLSTGIFSGTMVYVPGAGGVAGSFTFVEGDIVLGDVGLYEGRAYIFRPNNSQNYAEYRGTVTVNVIKADAIVTGKDVFEFVYGDDLRSVAAAPYLSFTTSPANLTLVSEEYNEWLNGLANGVTDGLVSETFEARVENKNYTGTRKFTIIINPRPINLIYRIAAAGGAMTEVKDQITVNFGAAADFKVAIDPSSIPEGLLTNEELAEMENGLIVRYHDYVELISELGEGSTVKPNSVGEYIVSVSTGLAKLFTVSEDTKYINYTVNRGNVESITFNTSLLTQTYGNAITIPSVTTVPSGVSVEVRFVGLEYVPSAAGEYPISAVVTDSNYNPDTVNGMLRILPKEIPIVNPVAYDKAYDDLSNIRVTAELGGIIVGDEVTLSLTAMTEGGSAEVGVHRVVLTSWTLGGLDAANYTVREPIYNLTAKITSNMVVDPNTESYITTDGGFSSNITVDFTEVKEVRNETNIFTRLFGQKATVQTISVRENGLDKVLDRRVKFYVRIPDEYLGCKNLTVEGLGNLSGITNFTREGNYITFYADSSGEIVFYTTDFPYWVIIIIAVLAIVILGLIVILIAAPLRRRKRIPDGARKIYKWRENAGSVEEAYRRKVKAQIEDRKRKWRY